jgi:hypothetical protein
MTSAFQGFIGGIVTFVKSPYFAILVADFAVGLPTAIKISLDATLVWLDVLQMALTTLVTSVKVANDIATHNMAQAAIDAKAGQDELSRLSKRFWTDMNNDVTDQESLFNGSYTAMWNKVFNDTMNMTAKIGDDGSKNTAKAWEKLLQAHKLGGQQLTDSMYTIGQTAGKNVTDGMAAGLAARSWVFDSEVQAMVQRSAARIQRELNAGSPSELFADIGGAPIPEGVALGIQRGIPKVESAIDLMIGRSQSSVPPSAITLSSGSSATTAVLEQIRDGILAMVQNTDPSHQPATTTGGSSGPTRTTQVPASLQAMLYQLLNDLENARRRGVAGYNF